MNGADGRRAVPAAIAFDFDGVLVESADIKTRAFAQLYARYPESVPAIVAYHLEHAGVSRYEKFRVIHKRILGLPLAEEELAELGRRFSELVLDEIVRCPFVPGARDFLEARHGEQLLFVASGTPQAELEEIVRARGLDGVFTGVFGTPATKGEILRGILAEHELAPGEVIFVGDALTDRLGASEAGVHFVARVPNGANNPFAVDEVVVEDLAELARRWADITDALIARVPAA